MGISTSAKISDCVWAHICMPLGCWLLPNGKWGGLSPHSAYTPEVDCWLGLSSPALGQMEDAACLVNSLAVKSRLAW